MASSFNPDCVSHTVLKACQPLIEFKFLMDISILGSVADLELVGSGVLTGSDHTVEMIVCFSNFLSKIGLKML